MMKWFLCFLFIGITACSCSDENKIPRDIMIKMTMKADPEAKLVIPTLGQGVTCAEYGPGCHGAHTVALKKMEMIVVEYDTMENAKKDALRLKAYYKKNWLFDDVMNEPVLERFVVETYGAENPNPMIKKP
jgi:hypothetical protein